jgi:signal peptidase I
MEPSFQEGQRVLVSKIAYHFHEPQRGDVIVFWPPFNSQDPFIKRIIALPGESVEIKEGKVYIDKNGSVIELNEPSFITPPQYTYSKNAVPENEYFVLGDNRNNSQDSHYGWTVKREDIIGKAWLSIWPPGEWGLVPAYSF